MKCEEPPKAWLEMTGYSRRPRCIDYIRHTVGAVLTARAVLTTAGVVAGRPLNRDSAELTKSRCWPDLTGKSRRAILTAAGAGRAGVLPQTVLTTAGAGRSTGQSRRAVLTTSDTRRCCADCPRRS